MNRRIKIEKHINLGGVGLEIGPGYSPFFSKKDGYRVKTLDHASAEDLRKKYEHDPKVSISQIEDVDFVWNGEPYVDLMPGQRFDWVFASHVVEHAPDFVGFINNCASVLHPNGVLALAVPDKRYTFDFFRQRSSLGAIIDAHLDKRTRPSVGNVVESAAYTLQENKNHSLQSELFDAFAFPASPDARHFSRVAANTAYHDVHVWAFTPNHFRMIIEILFGLGLIQLRETAFSPTSGCEFYIFLAPDGKGPMLPVADLAKKAQKERASHSAFVGSGTHWPRKVLGAFDRYWLKGNCKKLYRYFRKN